MKIARMKVVARSNCSNWEIEGIRTKNSKVPCRERGREFQWHVGLARSVNLHDDELMNTRCHQSVVLFRVASGTLDSEALPVPWCAATFCPMGNISSADSMALGTRRHYDRRHVKDVPIGNIMRCGLFSPISEDRHC